MDAPFGFPELDRCSNPIWIIGALRYDHLWWCDRCIDDLPAGWRGWAWDTLVAITPARCPKNVDAIHTNIFIYYYIYIYIPKKITNATGKRTSLKEQNIWTNHQFFTVYVLFSRGFCWCSPLGNLYQHWPKEKHTKNQKQIHLYTFVCLMQIAILRAIFR